MKDYSEYTHDARCRLQDVECDIEEMNEVDEKAT